MQIIELALFSLLKIQHVAALFARSASILNPYQKVVNLFHRDHGEIEKTIPRLLHDGKPGQAADELQYALTNQNPQAASILVRQVRDKIGIDTEIDPKNKETFETIVKCLHMDTPTASSNMYPQSSPNSNQMPNQVSNVPQGYNPNSYPSPYPNLPQPPNAAPLAMGPSQVPPVQQYPGNPMYGVPSQTAQPNGNTGMDLSNQSPLDQYSNSNAFGNENMSPSPSPVM